MKRLNLKGTKHGSLLVVKETGKKRNNYIEWECLCDCGNKFLTTSTRLSSKAKATNQSCGCLKINRYKEKAKKDLLGRKFNKLTIVEFFGRNINGVYLWKCLCECGNYKVIRSDSITRQQTTSCGCIGTSRLPPGQSALNALYGQYKKKSQRRKYFFNLTKEEFKKITSSNCFYCGIEPKQKRIHNTYKSIYLYNGIDRIDNNVGYIKGNIVPCCKICNRAKREDSQELFLNWIKQVIKHNAY